MSPFTLRPSSTPGLINQTPTDDMQVEALGDVPLHACDFARPRSGVLEVHAAQHQGHGT